VRESRRHGATRLVLVRHGETTGNRDRRFQTYDTPLSPDGRVQAECLAARLAAEPPFTALYASDLTRALETAGVVGARLGLRAHSVVALRELDLGDWKGRPHADMETVYAGGFEGWIAAGGTPRLPGPAGECLDDLVTRAVACLEDLIARHPGERVLLVSHGLTLGVLLAHAHGWDQVEAFRSRRVRLANTAVSEVERDTTGAWRCLVVGCTAHLPPALSAAGSGIGSA